MAMRFDALMERRVTNCFDLDGVGWGWGVGPQSRVRPRWSFDRPRLSPGPKYGSSGPALSMVIEFTSEAIDRSVGRLQGRTQPAEKTESYPAGPPSAPFRSPIRHLRPPSGVCGR